MDPIITNTTQSTSTDISNKKIIKKKTSHFFETYISKVLKQVNSKSGITSNAKQQLNSALCIVSKHISSIVINLTSIAKKKTISIKEIENALKITLSGELLSNSLSEGTKACQFFGKITNKGNNTSRQNKAEIIFPPSIVEKFLRNFGNTKIMVTNLAPVYFASVLEYITHEILDTSVTICIENKRNRLTVRDMELGVRNDIELNDLFNRLNITFLGGGVIPFIHTSLLKKHPKKKRVGNTANVDDKKKSRFRYGTVAIRNIKKQQKSSDELILSKSPFTKLVRHILKNNLPENDKAIKISKDVFIILQTFIEQYIVSILRDANFLAIHAGRIKLMPIDIHLINSLRNNEKNPYYVNENKNLLSMNNINEEELDINGVDDDIDDDDIDVDDVDVDVDEDEEDLS